MPYKPQEEVEDVAKRYRQNLEALTFNNKLVINSLTESANENRKYAQAIVTVIEQRMRQVLIMECASVTASLSFQSQNI